MSWKIEIKPTAEKYYLRLDKRNRQRVKEALAQLRDSDDPLSHPNVRALTGRLRGDYRLRVGKWRILFTADKENKMVYVYAVLPRGDAY